MKTRRGQTLLEGLVSSLILVIGVTFVLQAVLVSTAQNAGAGKLTEAASIANQMVASLERYDLRQLKNESGGLLAGGNCVSGVPLSYVGGLDGVTNITGGNKLCLSGTCTTSNVTAAPCVVDLDAYDTGAAANRKLVPGYDTTRSTVYKRMAVVFDDFAASRTVQVTVVVSFMELGQRRFVRRVVDMKRASNSGF